MVTLRPWKSTSLLTLEGMMWIVGLKLSRVGTVNSPSHTKVKNETERQALGMDVSSRSLGSSLVNKDLMRARVKGSRLGCLEDGGARLAATSSGFHLGIVHGPRLTMENMPCLYTENVVGESGTQIGASTARYEHYYEEQSHGAVLRVRNVA